MYRTKNDLVVTEPLWTNVRILTEPTCTEFYGKVDRLCGGGLGLRQLMALIGKFNTSGLFGG